MKNTNPYTPVGCSFIDYIEIFATERKSVEVEYINDTNERISVRTKLKTWETRDKVEYLLTSDGHDLRLDNVLSIGGINNAGACQI